QSGGVLRDQGRRGGLHGLLKVLARDRTPPLLRELPIELSIAAFRRLDQWHGTQAGWEAGASVWLVEPAKGAGPNLQVAILHFGVQPILRGVLVPALLDQAAEQEQPLVR